MDALKLEIYLEARRLLANGRYKYICAALNGAMRNVLGAPVEDWPDLFLEFCALYDGHYWREIRVLPDGEVISTSLFTPMVISPSVIDGIRKAWWTSENLAARLRCLDLIISRLY